MVSLLELIFQGFAEWLYSLILEIWNFFFSSLLDIMTLDFAYIKTHVPVVVDIEQIFLAVGWALLLGNLVFQAIRSMVSGLGFEGEDPKLLFARTFVFSFLLLASPQICEIGLNLTSRIMDLLEVPDAIDVHLVDSGVFGTLTAAWLLVIIFDIIIMFKVLKLLLEVAERYAILAVLTITAPLAFSMGGSKSTAEIFTGWCRMFGSMCLLMVTNVMFFKMLLSVVSTVPSGLDVFPWMVLIVTIVKVAKKADEIITRIGLNPAITGDRGRGFGGILAYTVLRTATAKVVHTLGAAATGGASAAAGAAGTAGAAGVAGITGVGGVTGAASRTGGQRSQSATSSQEQESASAPQSGGNDPPNGLAGRGSRGGGTSRKTFAPPGSHRAASFISGSSTEETIPKSAGGRVVGGFNGSTGRSGGFSGMGRSGGGFRSGVGRSGRYSGTGRLRPVTVYADDFDDSIEEPDIPRSGGAASTAATGTGLGRTGKSSPIVKTGIRQSTETVRGERTTEQHTRTTARSSFSQERRQTDARSTRRNITSSSGRPTVSRPGGAETGDGASSTAVLPRKQRGPSTVRKEQRTAVSITESSNNRSGGSGKRGRDHIDSKFKQQGSDPARQESSGQPPVSGRSRGSTTPPGPAVTRHKSVLEGTRRFRDRSPSPARQRQRMGSMPPGALVRERIIRPGSAETWREGSAQMEPPLKRRSPNPGRQKSGRPPVPTDTPLKGGGPAVRPGPAGTERRQTNRTTRMPPGKSNTGGPEHGKPRQ